MKTYCNDCEDAEHEYTSNEKADDLRLSALTFGILVVSRAGLEPATHWLKEVFRWATFSCSFAELSKPLKN
jgi:hypothetical protein